MPKPRRRNSTRSTLGWHVHVRTRSHVAILFIGPWYRALAHCNTNQGGQREVDRAPEWVLDVPTGLQPDVEAWRDRDKQGRMTERMANILDEKGAPRWGVIPEILPASLLALPWHLMGVWIGGIWNGHFQESKKYFSESQLCRKSLNFSRKSDLRQISSSKLSKIQSLIKHSMRPWTPSNTRRQLHFRSKTASQCSNQEIPRCLGTHNPALQKATWDLLLLLDDGYPWTTCSSFELRPIDIVLDISHFGGCPFWPKKHLMKTTKAQQQSQM